METNNLFGDFQIKATSQNDAGERLFSGIATVGHIADRENDTINMQGISFKLPLVLLKAHNHEHPVGQVISLKLNPMGQLEMTGKLPKFESNEQNSFVDKVNSTWSELKTQVLSSLSIGFRVLDWETNAAGGRYFKAIELYEISLCAVGMHQDAKITGLSTSKAANQRSTQATGVKLNTATPATRPKVAPTTGVKLNSGSGVAIGLPTNQHTKLLTPELQTLAAKCSSLPIMQRLAISKQIAIDNSQEVATEWRTLCDSLRGII